MFASACAIRPLLVSASLVVCCTHAREPAKVPAKASTHGVSAQPAATEANQGDLGHSIAATSGSQVNDCAAPDCTGNTTPALIQAISTRAGEARACYEQALKQEPTLGGRVTISWRVTRDGQSCPIQVLQNELADASTLVPCLRQVLEQKYPEPQAGCVELQLPLRFVPEYIESDAGVLSRS
jgi:hypothetical protein